MIERNTRLGFGVLTQNWFSQLGGVKLTADQVTPLLSIFLLSKVKVPLPDYNAFLPFLLPVVCSEQ